MSKIVVVDIESTGLDQIRHEVIEFGAVIVSEEPDTLKVVDEVEFKIKPENIESADPVALGINGYTESKWENAISKNEALEKISKIITDLEENKKNPGQKLNTCTVIGHNVHFDLAMIYAEFYKKQKHFYMNKYALDTNSIAKIVLKNKGLDSYSLRSLAEYFGIINENPHSALSDAKTTFEIYKRLKEL